MELGVVVFRAPLEATKLVSFIQHLNPTDNVSGKALAEFYNC